MTRVIAAEMLDALPADSPAAVGSRRDIARLNRIMGNAALLRRLMEHGMNGRIPQRIVEIGAGDGLFALGLAEYFARRWPAVEITLVDRKPAMLPGTRERFQSLGWQLNIVTADIFTWLATDECAETDLIYANLFLHQFTDAPLARLLDLCSRRSNHVLACEPRRDRLPWGLSRCVGLIGCNAVTRHDAPASVRAGFTQTELSQLWPAATRPQWSLTERRANLFSHTFAATKLAP